jgi:hypothetical protein
MPSDEPGFGAFPRAVGVSRSKEFLKQFPLGGDFRDGEAGLSAPS